MKILKKIGIGVGAIFLLYLVLCTFTSTSIDIRRSTVINASPEAIYPYINNLESRVCWSPWDDEDTSIVYHFQDKKEGAGAKYDWTSSSGPGLIEISEAIENKSVKEKLTFTDFNSSFDVDYTLEPKGSGTEVTWSMKGTMNAPFLLRGMFLFMNMNKMISEDYDRGLSHLKNIFEKYKGYGIREVRFPETHYVGVRQEMSMDSLGPFFMNHLPNMASKLPTGVTVMGAPTGIYYKIDETANTTDVMVSMPVNQKASVASPLVAVTLPARKALVIDYYGGYDNLTAAHEAMAIFLKEKGWKEEFPVLEEYIGDPMLQEPNKVLTRITYFYNR